MPARDLQHRAFAVAGVLAAGLGVWALVNLGPSPVLEATSPPPPERQEREGAVVRPAPSAPSPPPVAGQGALEWTADVERVIDEDQAMARRYAALTERALESGEGREPALAFLYRVAKSRLARGEFLTAAGEVGAHRSALAITRYVNDEWEPPPG